MNTWEENGSAIISWSRKHSKENNILIVGRQIDGKIDIINAFQGEEADDIYKKLIEKRPIK